jgi:integrase/recombinase XerD
MLPRNTQLNEKVRGARVVPVFLPVRTERRHEGRPNVGCGMRCCTYRDAFKLLLIFCEHEKGISPACLTLAQIDDELVRGFMDWIETTRTSIRLCIATMKKTGKPIPSYLTTEMLEAILQQPDRSTSTGRRDLLVLARLYDSAARVSELTDLVVRDIRSPAPATITLLGRGGRYGMSCL